MNQATDPNEGLNQLLSNFEAQIRNTPSEAQAVLSLMRNWLVPILNDFGVAINQTAFALGDVANAAAEAQSTAERTMTGEQLSTAADLLVLLEGTLRAQGYFESPNSEQVSSVLDVFFETLEDWLPEDFERGAPLPESAEESVAPEPEPEPEPVVAEEPSPKKAPAKRRARKKPAVKEAS